MCDPTAMWLLFPHQAEMHPLHTAGTWDQHRRLRAGGGEEVILYMGSIMTGTIPGSHFGPINVKVSHETLSAQRGLCYMDGLSCLDGWHPHAGLCIHSKCALQ